MDPVVEMAGVTRRFGPISAVQDVSIHIQRGELLALVGPDGAGKTTTLRLLRGILAPTAGTVRAFGYDVPGQAELVRERTGYVAQSFSLYSDLTVLENLTFFARVYGVAPDERARRAHDLLAFSALDTARDRLAGQLSGGMKQKLALACALIHEPDLLLLDEPTTGIDPVSRRELWAILAALLARGKTIVLSTPYMDEAERCTRVALLADGRLIALDTPHALIAALPHTILAVRAPELSRGALLAALAGLEGAHGRPRVRGVEVRLAMDDPVRAITAVRRALAAAGASHAGVGTVTASLEDVFIAHTAEHRSLPHLPADASRHVGPRAGRAGAGPAIVVRDLTRRFGEITAIDHLSFDVAHGETFGFLGPNGSGKTTTIRMICGILVPSSGRAEVLGHPTSVHPEGIRRQIGYLSQRFGLYTDLTVRENLEFYGGMYGLQGKILHARRDELLTMLGLHARQHMQAGILAGGWRQRLALGCALLHRPRVLLLDEPTSGVDPASRRDFWDLIYELASGGATILVTTHSLDEAEHCDRLALLHNSRLIALGTPAELKNTVRGVLLEVRGAPLVDALRALAPWQPALYGTALHIMAADEAVSEQLRLALAHAGITTSAIRPIAPTLEDVFLSLVHEQRPSQRGQVV